MDGGRMPSLRLSRPNLLRRPEGRPPPSSHFHPLVEPATLACAAPQGLIKIGQRQGANGLLNRDLLFLALLFLTLECFPFFSYHETHLGFNFLLRCRL